MPTDTADPRAYLAQTFYEAEQAGLRIALKGRLVALVLLGAFLVLSRLSNPAHAAAAVGGLIRSMAIRQISRLVSSRSTRNAAHGF